MKQINIIDNEITINELEIKPQKVSLQELLNARLLKRNENSMIKIKIIFIVWVIIK